MPPKKESVKERKGREQAEAMTAAFHTERKECETAEDKARAHLLLQERVGFLSTANAAYAKMLDPHSRMTVRRTEYDDVKRQLQEEAGAGAERIMSIQKKFAGVQHAHAELQVELAHLRQDSRKMAGIARREVGRMRARVEERLDCCVADIENSILHQRSDTLESAQHLNVALEENMKKVMQMTEEAKAAALKVTTLQQEHSSLHSRIPRRIRNKLFEAEKEDLLLILDTLSFEDSTLEYLLCRYPPTEDSPFD